MRKQKGIALVAALGVIIVVGIISAFVCRVAVVSNKVANRGGITLESRSNAESAMNAGYMALSKRIDQIETAADATKPDDIIYDKRQYCSGSNRRPASGGSTILTAMYGTSPRPGINSTAGFRIRKTTRVTGTCLTSPIP